MCREAAEIDCDVQPLWDPWSQCTDVQEGELNLFEDNKCLFKTNEENFKRALTSTGTTQILTELRVSAITKRYTPDRSHRLRRCGTAAHTDTHQFRSQPNRQLRDATQTRPPAIPTISPARFIVDEHADQLCAGPRSLPTLALCTHRSSGGGRDGRLADPSSFAW